VLNPVIIELLGKHSILEDECLDMRVITLPVAGLVPPSLQISLFKAYWAFFYGD